MVLAIILIPNLKREELALTRSLVCFKFKALGQVPEHLRMVSLEVQSQAVSMLNCLKAV
jgi:hypothetical protein